MDLKRWHSTENQIKMSDKINLHFVLSQHPIQEAYLGPKGGEKKKYLTQRSKKCLNYTYT